tara:strand:+ start:5232 stop:5498 length:267 start_codon:yes stop_codon:yes gene_type:complete
VRSNKAIKHVRQAALDSQRVARPLWRRYNYSYKLRGKEAWQDVQHHQEDIDHLRPPLIALHVVGAMVAMEAVATAHTQLHHIPRLVAV